MSPGGRAICSAPGKPGGAVITVVVETNGCSKSIGVLGTCEHNTCAKEHRVDVYRMTKAWGCPNLNDRLGKYQLPCVTYFAVL